MKMEGEEREQECMAGSGEDKVPVNIIYVQNFISCTPPVVPSRDVELNMVHIPLQNNRIKRESGS